MPRKLKTYTTSAGFFDLAIAAPSMKAALEAWGAGSNLFHQGFARESTDRDIVAATMAKPGVVLRRPVGTDARFSEDAELPSSLPVGTARRKPEKPPKRTAKRAAKPVDDKRARQAAFEFEEEQRRREREARKEEAARKQERARRNRAIAAAEAALEKAERNHKARTGEIDKARAAIDRKQEAEDARWRKEREWLEEALRKARSPSHLRVV